jgi:hypothetical protein
MKRCILIISSKVVLATVILQVLNPPSSDGHDEHLHVSMTESAFQSSDGVSAFLIDNYGSENVPFKTTPALFANPAPFNRALSFSPLDWTKQGSYWEDMTLYNGYTMRCVDHFYTVVPGRTPGEVIGLTDASEPWYAFGFILPGNIENSFIWASQNGTLGPLLLLPLSVTGPNSETWQNARDYEYAALTSTAKATRDENMAHTLYALGHVLHLNQDLSQPDHVRNDNHNIPEHRHIENYGADHYKKNPQWFNLQPHGWLYWQTNGFTKLLDFWDRGLYAGNASALNNDAAGTGKLGLAEFSNGNFLGEDALYKEYFKTADVHYFPFPSLQTGTDFPSVRAHLATGTATSYLKDGRSISRIKISKIADGIPITYHSFLNYLGAVFPRHGGAITRVASTINDTNVLQEYHSVLIPKAVEYSAGILDYFFRGQFGINVSNISGSTYSLQITNNSGQDLTNGAFHLFYDNSSGARAELTGLAFSSGYSGVLASGGAINASFTAPTGATRYTLVYQGTIGTTGSAALDPVDDGIAIATKAFTITPPQCVLAVDNIPGPPSDYDDFAGIYTTTTADFVVPAPGATVQVAVNSAAGVIPGEGDIISGAGEFEIVGFTTSPDPETITFKNKSLVSNVAAGTTVPSGTAIQFREDLEPWKAVYVPSVNRIFVNASWDTILVIRPDNMILESFFHVSNLIDDYAPSLAYAADVDRLYLISSYGGVYVVNPHTHTVDTVISKPANYQINAYDGFYDPVNHRVGFAYRDLGVGGNLLLINTSDNSIAADITDVSDIAAEYSAVDDRVYAANGTTVSVYSGAGLSFVTSLQASGRVLLLRHATVTGEIYGYGPNGGFYIDPLGSSTNATTADFTAPAIGANVTVTLADTSGMIVGQPVSINAVGWTIAAVDSGTQFEAKNLSVTPGTVITTGAVVTWGGPKYTDLPMVTSVGGLFYSTNYQKVVFTGGTHSDTKLFNPISKLVECTVPNTQQDDLIWGCEGTDGKLFVPYQQTAFPFAGGVYVIH